MADTFAVDFAAVFDAAPTPYLILTPGLIVVAVNRAYEQVTGTPRDRVVGRAMFEAFPDDVETTLEAGSASAAQVSGAAQLRASFERVLRTKAPDAMSLLRYAVADETGTFTTHWWSPLNAPVLGSDGQVVMLLHRAERVTDYYLRRQHQLEHGLAGQAGQAIDPGPWDPAEADLYARGDELRRALAQEQAAAERLARLVDVSVRLSAATTVADLISIVIHRGLAVLGAEGGAVATAATTHTSAGPGAGVSDGGKTGPGWDLVLTGSLGDEAAEIFSHIPIDSSLPVAAAARSGQTVLLTGEDECLAFSPDMADALRTTGLSTWLSVPLVAGGRALGAITAGWRGERAFTDHELDVVGALVAQCAQTLQRLQSAEAEHRAAEEAHRSAQAERAAARSHAALVAIAGALADADTEDEVLAVIAGQGAQLMPQAVWGLGIRVQDGAAVRVLGTEDIDAGVRARVEHLPATFGLPVVRSAIEGSFHFLADLASTSVAFSDAGALYAAAGLHASASLPLRARGQLLGSLSVAFAEAHEWVGQERDLLVAFAGLTAQALSRIAAHEAEQAALVEAAGIAETLQRSMLTAPPEPDHLQIVVRYTAAAKAAEVGGDWYDAFMTSDGLTSLVIGDVTGHDMRAAAVMGQLRNLVRGIAFTLGEPPAGVLAAVDRAAAGLGIETVATAIVAQVEQDEAHRAAGTRLLRWSNAGHLPPLLITADGATSYLQPAETDLVLGWDPATERHDHELVLAPGATVLLYTDGLIERRGVGVDLGLAWLAQAVGEWVSSSNGTLDELCDGLLNIVDGHLNDDVALLALRAHPEDEARPAEAGPVRVPAGLRAAQEAAPQDGPL